MKKVIFYEVFEEERKALEQFLPDNISAVFYKETIQEKKEDVPSSNLISIRTQSIIPTCWADKLSGILSRSQGYDHLKEFLNSTNTSAAYGYLKPYCSNAVAEHAITLSMMLIKRINQQQNNFQTFNRDGLTAMDFNKRKVLVVGVGNIGIKIVRMTQSLNIQTKGVDINQNNKDVEYVTLKEGIDWADVIICALPLTEKTHGLIDRRILEKSFNKPFIINISRGEITPINDLKYLLGCSKISGIALDVFEQEKQLADELRRDNQNTLSEYSQMILELSKMPNVIFTPHNAFNTQEALVEKAKQTIIEIKNFFENQKFSNQISS